MWKTGLRTWPFLGRASLGRLIPFGEKCSCACSCSANHNKWIILLAHCLGSAREAGHLVVLCGKRLGPQHPLLCQQLERNHISLCSYHHEKCILPCLEVTPLALLQARKVGSQNGEPNFPVSLQYLSTTVWTDLILPAREAHWGQIYIYIYMYLSFPLLDSHLVAYLTQI